MLDEAIIPYIVIASFVMPLFLSAGLIWFFITYQKKVNEQRLEMQRNKIKEQALIIEKQQALEKERTRIAGEMHDDIGGGLTTIKFLSQNVLRKIEDGKQKQQVSKILSNAQELVTNMSEIIWAMNSRFDTIDNLIAYTRRYTMEFLKSHDIQVDFTSDQEQEVIIFRGEDRRNVFLTIKEALNNIVKHSGATEVIITIKSNEILSVIIHDNGKGLQDPSLLGNGFRNMESRIEALGGSVTFENENGLKTTLLVPIPEDNDLIPIIN